MHHKTKLKFIDKKIEQEHISISYPQFQLKHKKLQNKLNYIILNEILDFIRKQTDHLKEDNLLYGEYNITLITNNLLSLIIDCCIYNDKSYASYNILKSITINIKNAYLYNFHDIFIKGSNYENIINKSILEYIRDSGVPIIEELANINDNRSFFFTEDSLVVYYNIHKNSLYSLNYCVPQFHIPLNLIKSIINLESISLEC